MLSDRRPGTAHRGRRSGRLVRRAAEPDSDADSLDDFIVDDTDGNNSSSSGSDQSAASLQRRGSPLQRNRRRRREASPEPTLGQPAARSRRPRSFALQSGSGSDGEVQPRRRTVQRSNGADRAVARPLGPSVELTGQRARDNLTLAELRRRMGSRALQGSAAAHVITVGNDSPPHSGPSSGPAVRSTGSTATAVSTAALQRHSSAAQPRGGAASRPAAARVPALPVVRDDDEDALWHSFAMASQLASSRASGRGAADSDDGGLVSNAFRDELDAVRAQGARAGSFMRPSATRPAALPLRSNVLPGSGSRPAIPQQNGSIRRSGSSDAAAHVSALPRHGSPLEEGQLEERRTRGQAASSSGNGAQRSATGDRGDSDDGRLKRFSFDGRSSPKRLPSALGNVGQSGRAPGLGSTAWQPPPWRAVQHGAPFSNVPLLAVNGVNWSAAMGVSGSGRGADAAPSQPRAASEVRSDWSYAGWEAEAARLSSDMRHHSLPEAATAAEAPMAGNAAYKTAALPSAHLPLAAPSSTVCGHGQEATAAAGTSRSLEAAGTLPATATVHCSMALDEIEARRQLKHDAAEAVKAVLKPLYAAGRVDKEGYKQILEAASKALRARVLQGSLAAAELRGEAGAAAARQELKQLVRGGGF